MLLTLYVNKLLWHLELPGVEGLVVRDVALGLGDGDDHVVSLLAVHLLRRDGALEMVLLGGEKEEELVTKHCLQVRELCRLSVSPRRTRQHPPLGIHS